MANYYNEHDPYAAQWLRNLIDAGQIPKGYVDERSIEDVKPIDLIGFTQCHFFAGIGVWSYALKLAGWPEDKPVWTGSCPCQPFSASGKRGGFADERHLWPAWHWLIKQCAPELILGEQVAGKDSEPWIDLVHADMESLDYAYGCLAFPAAGVGAPHIRDRTYWVARATWSGRPEGRPRPRGGPIARGGSFNGLAYATSKRWDGGQNTAGARGRISIETGGSFNGLADSSSTGLEIGKRLRRIQPGTVCTCAREAAQCRCDVSGLAEHEHEQRSNPKPGSGIKPVAPGRYEAASAITGLCSASDLGDATGERCGEKGQFSPGPPQRTADASADGRAGPTNGFWREADWLGCRNGKWRPIEPGLKPLVNGPAGSVGRMRADQETGAEVPRKDQGSRIGRLKGYGNAINAEAAKEFILATMHVLNL